MNWNGLLIGVITFIIIGVFHPIVIKAEYYLGTKCWWVFLLFGIATSIVPFYREHHRIDSVRSHSLFLFLVHQGNL